MKLKALPFVLLLLLVAAWALPARAQTAQDEKKINGVLHCRVDVKISPNPKAGVVKCLDLYDSSKGKTMFWARMWSQAHCRAYPAPGWKVGHWNWREGELCQTERCRFRVTEHGELEVVFKKE